MRRHTYICDMCGDPAMFEVDNPYTSSFVGDYCMKCVPKMMDEFSRSKRPFGLCGPKKQELIIRRCAD